MKNKILNVWKENKFFLIVSIILFPFLILIIHIFLGLMLDFITNKLTIKENFWTWLKTAFTLTKGWPIILLVLFIYFLIFTKWLKNKPVKPHIKEVDTNDYGHAKWMENIKFNQLFSQIQFNKAHSNSGFIVGSQKKEEKTLVNLANNTHALIIGGTGSGKTQGLVIPTIQTNAFSDLKPSMIITDPKGELFQSQSLLLQKQGYTIKVLNLRDATNSISWNPLATVYDKWLQARIIMLKKQEQQDLTLIAKDNIKCFIHNQYPCQECLDKIKGNYWIYQNHWFVSNTKCDQVLKQQQLILEAQMRNDLKDLCTSLYPSASNENNHSFWTKNARKLFKAVVLAMIEDVEQEIRLSEVLTCEEEQKIIENCLPLTKFNCATVARIISQQTEMIKWLQAYPDSGATKMAANTILSSMGGQLSGIIGTTATELELFEEPLIQNIICQNDFNFNEISLKPTAIFIIVPDEKTEHHFFVSLFIGQVYKALVEQASKNENGKLSRTVYFLLDEFANFPAINNFEAMITVSRSRNIFFQLIIQDFNQLESKYNKAITNVIFANCSLHLFLQTMNLETAKKYSDMIGQKTVLKVSVSGKGKTQNQSSNLDYKTLISASELIQLAPNEAIIVTSQQLPAKVKLLPWYQVEPHYYGQTSQIPKLKLVDFYHNYYYDFHKSYFFPKEPKITKNHPNNSKTTIFNEIKKLKALLSQYEGKTNLDIVAQEMKQTLINEIRKLENLQKEKESSNNDPISND